MNLGIREGALGGLPLLEALKFAAKAGIETIEIDGAGRRDPDAMRAAVVASGLRVSAVSAPGNPVHPVADTAKRHDGALRGAILLAEQLGVDTVCALSGVPGECDGATYPNWPTMVWPFDGVAILDYQWKRRLIPYWRALGEFADRHGVTKIAIRMQPGYSVFNPETLLRLREGAGDFIGADFDPGQLIWQGIDCAAAIRRLSGCIHHFRANDALVNWDVMGRNGFYDPFGEAGDKPYAIKIPPYGTGEHNWRRMMTALRDAGYDGALVIDGRDGGFERFEGIQRAADFLSAIRYLRPAGQGGDAL